MNDNAPESERWVPVKAGEFCAKSAKNSPELHAFRAYCSPALDRARREAEAVIAKHFPPKP